MSYPAYKLFEKWYGESASGNPSAEDHLESRYKEQVGAHFEEINHDDVRCVFNAFKNYIQVDQGFPTIEVRMPPGEGYVDIPGGYIRVPDGMEKMVRRVARHLPSTLFRLNSPVWKIEWEGEDARVLCTGEAAYLADHVIVTCPLGVLKEEAHHMFHPPLTEDKLSAIRNIGFGRIGKIFIEYDEPFWDKTQGRMNLAWTDDEMLQGVKQHQWWENTSNQWIRCLATPTY